MTLLGAPTSDLDRGWSDRRTITLARALDLFPATSVAGFFPPPPTPTGSRAALHREAKKPSPAAFHCVPALKGAGRSPPVSRPLSRPRWARPRNI